MSHDEVKNPFPGLRPFEFGDNHLFFGRDQQTTELTTRLRKNRFVAVVGTSGSGKSSLVNHSLLETAKCQLNGDPFPGHLCHSISGFISSKCPNDPMSFARAERGLDIRLSR